MCDTFTLTAFCLRYVVSIYHYEIVQIWRERNADQNLGFSEGLLRDIINEMQNISLYPLSNAKWFHNNICMTKSIRKKYRGDIDSKTGNKKRPNILFVWSYYLRTYVYANFEAIAVFHYEHRSIYSFIFIKKIKLLVVKTCC